MTPDQCRAARAMAGISQQTFADAAHVAKATVAAFESGKRQPHHRTLRDMRDALMDGYRVAVLHDGSVKRYTPEEVAALEP